MDRPGRQRAKRPADAGQGPGRLSGFHALAAAAALALLTAAPGHADDGGPLHELVDTAAQRLATADPVAAAKWLTGAAITDPDRVREVLTTVAGQADSAGIPADYVTGVFADQIDATEAIQYSRFSWWKLDPAAAPHDAPDLASSREVIDELNLRMVAAIARDWPALRSPDCGETLGAAKSAVAERRGFDPLYRRALDTATRSYCVG